jgi:hypothetical protein
MTSVTSHRPPPPAQRSAGQANLRAAAVRAAAPASVGQLVGNLGAETGTLVRQELTLAMAETIQKAKAAGARALTVCAGAALGAVSLMALVASIVVVLSSVMALWMSALVVGATLGLISIAMMALGVASLRSLDMRPAETIRTLKESKSWAQELVR